MRYIDLHTHSTESDGKCTPEEVIDDACAEGLAAIALTDHDTVAGLSRAEKHARLTDISFIKGIEISCADEDCSEIHIVGLFLKNTLLFESLKKKIYTPLLPYIPQIIETLGSGISDLPCSFKNYVDLKEIILFQQEKNPGKTREEIFDELMELPLSGEAGNLGTNILFRATPEKAIRAIHRMGGASVLAHPKRLGLQEDWDNPLFRKIAHLKEAGLDGIECHYRDYSDRFIARVSNYAESLDLAIGGGSDYHARPGERIGRNSKGNLIVPASCLRDLKSRTQTTRHEIHRESYTKGRT